MLGVVVTLVHCAVFCSCCSRFQLSCSSAAGAVVGGHRQRYKYKLSMVEKLICQQCYSGDLDE